MPSLSIVIPAIGGEKLLEQGLVSVLQHRPEDSEVIVVLRESYDDPYGLEEEIRFLQVHQRSGPAACVRAAFEVCESPLLHVLGCGWEVTESWAEAAISAFDDPSVAAVAPIVFQARNPDSVRSMGIEYASFGRYRRSGRGQPVSQACGKTIGPELRAAFYRAESIRSVGGFPTDLEGDAAAVDLALSHRAAGYRAIIKPESQVFAAPSEDSCRTRPSFQRGIDEERLFWRHLPRNGWLSALLLHPWYVVDQSLRELPSSSVIPQIVGRLKACLELPLAHRHHQRLRRLRVRRLDTAQTVRAVSQSTDSPIERRRAA